MKYLRVKIDDQEGYLKAFENVNKNGNEKAPDFKGENIAVWENEGESVKLVKQAVDAGASDPKVIATIQA